MDDAILRRGFVLLALRAQYPLALLPTMLDQAVRAAYLLVPNELAADLIYLERKGYIEIIDQTIRSRLHRSFLLTEKGVDIADGAISDPAVHIERPVG